MDSKKLYFFNNMVTFVDYSSPDYPYETWYNSKLEIYRGTIIDITGNKLTLEQFETLQETPDILLGLIESLHEQYGH